MSVGGIRAWLAVGAALAISSVETWRAEQPGCGWWTMCFLLERSGCAVWLSFAPVYLVLQLLWR